MYAAPAGDDRKRNSTRWWPSTAASAATLTCHHREREERGPDNRTSLRVPRAAVLPTLLVLLFLFAVFASLPLFLLHALPPSSPLPPFVLFFLQPLALTFLARGKSGDGRPLRLTCVLNGIEVAEEATKGKASYLLFPRVAYMSGNNCESFSVSSMKSATKWNSTSPSFLRRCVCEEERKNMSLERYVLFTGGILFFKVEEAEGDWKKSFSAVYLWDVT